MKIRFLSLSLLVGLAITPVSARSQNPSAMERTSVMVEFENEAVTLARGFAAAFERLPAGARYILVNTPSGPAYLPDSVRSIEAHEGVILIRMDKGLVHVISARDIVRITNERP